jgi:hypothetical protein
MNIEKGRRMNKNNRGRKLQRRQPDALAVGRLFA